MPNERFTDLPTTGSAQLTDIICAVQGYTSPSNLGLSVQETLQQVYNLFAQNVIQNFSGNPNGNVAGTTFQFCWDSTNHILYVCTTSGSTSTAVWTKSITLTAGAGISIAQGGSNIVISSSGAGFNWNTVSGTSATMVAQNGYITNNSGLVSLTLPTTASSTIGDSIEVAGLGSGGWSVLTAAGQAIKIGISSASTSVSSTNQYDSLRLTYIASATWSAIGAPQSSGLTIV